VGHSVATFLDHYGEREQPNAVVVGGGPKVRALPENNTRQGFFERPDLETFVAALTAYL